MSREIIRTLPTASSNDLVWMAWYDALISWNRAWCYSCWWSWTTCLQFS